MNRQNKRGRAHSGRINSGSVFPDAIGRDLQIDDDVVQPRSLVISDATSLRSGYNRVDLRLECTQVRGIVVRIQSHKTVEDLGQPLDMRTERLELPAHL